MARAMTDTTDIKAFLFDIGGVLVRWEPEHLYAQMFDDKAEMDEFLSTCCTMQWHHNHDSGVPMAENAKPLIEKFPHWREYILAWESRWADMFLGPMPGMAEMLQAIKDKNYPLYALTNMPADIMHVNYREFPFLRLFDEIFVSAEMRLTKPDPAAYQHALSHMPADPAHTIFIDDVQKNVDAAIGQGMQSVLFRDAKTLMHDLAQRRVIL